MSDLIFISYSRRDSTDLRFARMLDHLIAENGTAQILGEVLDVVTPYAMASVYVGLKVSPLLHNIYAKNSYLRLSEDIGNQFGERLPLEIEERLRKLAAAKCPNYPLYKHTSCAVSYVLSIPDYNATIYRDPICKGSNCPDRKRRICESARYIPTYQQVQMLFSQLGLENHFTITDRSIEVSGAITQMESRPWTIDTYAIELLAESGTLADSIMIQEGYRPLRPNQEINLDDDICDVLFVLIMIANHYGINLEEAYTSMLRTTFEKLSKRNNVASKQA